MDMDHGKPLALIRPDLDRKSTRLNSSHSQISYAVFCLKKKKNHRLYLAYWRNLNDNRVPACRGRIQGTSGYQLSAHPAAVSGRRSLAMQHDHQDDNQHV